MRENQRRHRARRKDYIASLEAKLAETEAQLAAAHAEIAILRREREQDIDADTRLAAATSAASLDANLHSEMLALERLVDSLPTPVLGETMTMTIPLPPPLPISTDPSSPAALSHTPLVSALIESTSSLPITTPPGPPPCCEDPPPSSSPSLSTTLSLTLTTPSPECSSCHTRPAPAPTESTTLCAQAYVLIAQQNFRGIDAGTIRLWLGQGYRRARREGEGCRVENGALFRLLDYISGV